MDPNKPADPNDPTAPADPNAPSAGQSFLKGLLSRLPGAVYQGGLRAVGGTLPADIQSAIGLVKGVIKTGSLPRSEGDSIIFDVPAGEMPQANGQVVFLPEGSDEETRVHEMRHASQAANVPYAPLIGSIGALTEPSPGNDLYTNPLEADAYLSQPDSPATRQDIETMRLMAKGSPTRTEIMELLARLHGKQ